MVDRLLVRAPLSRPNCWRHQPPAAGRAAEEKLVNLQLKRAFAAMAHSDVDVVLLSYEPEAEVWMKSMAGVVGISACYRGYEGIRTLYADLDEAFGDWGWTARAVVDGGDRLAVRTDFVGSGRGSGVQTTVNDGGTAVKLSAPGRVGWQEWFVEQQGWSKALAWWDCRSRDVAGEREVVRSNSRTLGVPAECARRRP